MAGSRYIHRVHGKSTWWIQREATRPKAARIREAFARGEPGDHEALLSALGRRDLTWEEPREINLEELE